MLEFVQVRFEIRDQEPRQRPADRKDDGRLGVGEPDPLGGDRVNVDASGHRSG